MSLNERRKKAPRMDMQEIQQDGSDDDKEWLNDNKNPYRQPKKRSNLNKDDSSFLYRQKLAFESAEEKQNRRQ